MQCDGRAHGKNNDLLKISMELGQHKEAWATTILLSLIGIDSEISVVLLFYLFSGHIPIYSRSNFWLYWGGRREDISHAGDPIYA